MSPHSGAVVSNGSTAGAWKSLPKAAGKIDPQNTGRVSVIQPTMSPYAAFPPELSVGSNSAAVKSRSSPNSSRQDATPPS